MGKYITKSNGKMILNINNINSKCFVDAIMTKDIAEIQILSVKDKKTDNRFERGGPDVIIKHLDGRTGMISRKELIDNYRHINGNSIKIIKLKNNKKYIVYRLCNERVNVLRVPNKYGAILNGQYINGGNYLICKVDESGNIVDNRVKSISSRLFKKAFKIPMNKYLKNILDGENKIKAFVNNVNLENKKDNTIIKNTNEIVQDVKNIRAVEENKYNFTVINRIVDYNGRLIGYVVREISSGITRNLKPIQLAKLCSNKTVSNVMIVNRADGTKFLKGNGCRLESIPPVIL